MFGISAFAQAPYAALGAQDIALALTGVSATGNVGTVSRGGTSFALSGVLAAGSVGSVGVARSSALTGVQAAGSAGNVIAVYWILVNNSETSNWALVDNAETSNWALVETD
jgi:hypothetical protein